ncbi:hypothetical protein [Halodesulfovibrio marinisediminis]|uniref:Uncharacterized protein n=1 Tax=Halodesulfovibrio marinisediminis DSM 17456 TaxID=1121457 RepID=A0A1N6HZ10_9BACT|nr:hypothetical protein [Halodesulfovibrio marinisediminis]SIO25058.1 hypothetical protein SAMN02745161_2294 [Halodesulfovibrio marinisediminis DSM 17456]
MSDTTNTEMSGTQKFILELANLLLEKGLKAGFAYGSYLLLNKMLDQGRSVSAEASNSSCKLSCGTPTIQPTA